MRVKRFLLTVAALWAVDATGARGAPPRLQQLSGPAGAHTDDRGGRAADLPGFQKRIQTTVEKTLPTIVSFIGAAGVVIFCLEDRRTGERLPVRLEREGRQMELTLELEAAPDPEYPSECTSSHADAPPTVITADIPVLHHECGTPAVGVDGAVVGVIISRFGPSGSFIIPGDCVASRLADLRAGKPLSGFPAPAAKPPVPASSAVRE